MQKIWLPPKRFITKPRGLEVILRNELLLAFRCGAGVLLIFDPRKSAAPGQEVPSHGATGVGHVAFAARPPDLPAWREQLHRAGVAIESEIEWQEGACAIYFRDPAGNIIELAPPTL